MTTLPDVWAEDLLCYIDVLDRDRVVLDAVHLQNRFEIGQRRLRVEHLVFVDSFDEYHFFVASSECRRWFVVIQSVWRSLELDDLLRRMNIERLLAFGIVGNTIFL